MSHRVRLRQLFADQRMALEAFFRRRIRQGQDAVDLTQEVYLRLLRAGDAREIENAEAYLFTIANNLVREYSVTQRVRSQREEITDPAALPVVMVEPTFDGDVDYEGWKRRLKEVLPELPPRCQAALAMAYQEELSQQAIAKRLNVSKTMARKILSQALALCRKRMIRQGAA